MVVPGRLITAPISVRRFSQERTEHGAITEEGEREEEGERKRLKEGGGLVSARPCAAFPSYIKQALLINQSA